MIRPFTLLTALLAIGSGYYLYQAKHRTRLLDERIASVEREAAASEARIAVLHAEWALENSPSRLADLAAHYLVLTPMQPSQAVSMANLASHLPPPGASGAGPPAIAESDVAALAALPELDLYASLDYFSGASSEARPVMSRLTAAAAAQAQPVAAPAEAASRDRPAGVAVLAPPPPPAALAALPALVAKAARPVVVSTAAERAMPPRREPVPALTSALGGAYPDLAPPAPLSGSH